MLEVLEVLEISGMSGIIVKTERMERMVKIERIGTLRGTQWLSEIVAKKSSRKLLTCRRIGSKVNIVTRMSNYSYVIIGSML